MIEELPYMAKASEEKCQFCEGADTDTHRQLLCPICKEAFTCTTIGADPIKHLLSDACPAEYCKVHNFYDGREWHGSKCDHCGEQRKCDQNECKNNCCKTCGVQDNSCHCHGPCKDEKCPKRTESTEKLSRPQHEASLLVMFQIDDRGDPRNIKNEAINFYSTLALIQKYPEKRAVGDDIIKSIAEHLLLSIIAACSGEVRYTQKYVEHVVMDIAFHASSQKGRLRESTQRNIRKHFGSRWLHSRPFGMGRFWEEIEANSVGDRSGAAKYFKQEVLDPYGFVHATRILRNWFAWHYLSQGKGGIGGPLWGQAADMAYQYATGKIGDITFVDSAFDMQHNNASLFTKTHRIPNQFTSWLDTRAATSDLSWFIDQAPGWILERFGEKKKDAKTGKVFKCSLISGVATKNNTPEPRPQGYKAPKGQKAKPKDPVVKFAWGYHIPAASPEAMLRNYKKGNNYSKGKLKGKIK